MAYKQMFFVQVFGINGKNRLVDLRTYEVRDADEAKLKASWLAGKSVGVVAFAQMVDVEAADAQEPELLAFHGRVPREVKDRAA